jgi:endo-1,4-beta-xylanase
VFHGGKWHLFYSARDKTDYSIGYVSGERLADLADAKRTQLTQLHSAQAKYAAAPQVFYFRPRQKWYLIFQTTDAHYQPVYSTTARLNDPASWTEPQVLAAKTESAKWIDFWVICDETTAYLFLTRDHKEVVVMSTPIAMFPSGFSSPRVVFAPVHEAVHVYRQAKEYVMLYEQQGSDGLRHFGLARSTRLDGGWQVSEERFAGSERLMASADRWTDEVSHGELLRSGFDERLEIPRSRWEFLIQGMPRASHTGRYPLLPWKLGLITLDR